MQNPNAIVSHTIQFKPAIEGAPVEMLRKQQDLSVELEGGQIIRFNPEDSRSVGFIEILNGLKNQHMPVYVEVEPSTRFITRLLIPYLTRISGFKESQDKKSLDVSLDFSHARHVLPINQEDYPDLKVTLDQAIRTGNPVLLTEDQTHHIIDIRFYKPNPDSSLPYPEPPPRIPPPWPWPLEWLRKIFLWLWWRPWWPWWWFRCISASRAQQVFDAMNATSCDPLTVPVPCIPFRYPDDGCWGRAHEMRRLMVNMGLRPKKVWIEGWLNVSTRNNPNCSVSWGWHVAPTLCVRHPLLWFGREMVIDPSLFTTPVSQATWKSVQGDPSATLTPTAGEIFYLWGNVTDPTYSATNSVLATYRLQLQNRALTFGPPPYANCP